MATPEADESLAELALAPWRAHDQRIASTGLLGMLRTMPQCLRLLAGLAWQSSRPSCLVTVVLQLAAATIAAFGLLATASALAALLATGPTPQRLVAALPTIVLVAAAYAGRGLAETAVAAANARLIPGGRTSRWASGSESAWLARCTGTRRC